MSDAGNHPFVDASQRLLEIVRSLVVELGHGGRGEVSLDSALDRDLGLDSLSRVELLARVSDAFQVDLPSELLETAQTPRDLLTALSSAAKGGAGVTTGWGGDGGTRPSPHAPSSPRTSPLDADNGEPDAASTLLEMFDWHCRRHPERLHVRFEQASNVAKGDGDTVAQTLSYGELAGSASRIASGLQARGVNPGDCVALMLPSGLDFFRVFVGILLARAVPVPMYPPARPAGIEDHLRRQVGILRNCCAPVLITFERVRPLAAMLRGLAPELEHVITPTTLLEAGVGSSSAELRPDPRRSDPRVDPDALALIQYTSGSTGDPKGVALSHRNLLANIRAWGQASGLCADDVCVSWLPLYHDMGLIGAWLGSAYYGLPLVLMSPLDFLVRPESWLWAIHRHRGTVTAAPNFAFDLCVKRASPERLHGLDLASWRLAANGAEPVNPETLDRFAAAFSAYGFRPEALAPVYGLAECSVGLAVPPPGRGCRIDRIEREALMREGLARPVAPEASETGGEVLRFPSCGAPLPGHQVRVVSSQGVVLPEREIGLLEFRGPSATQGYYRNPEANAALFHDDWLVSGDYAYLADGEIFITGREKDMIVRGGRNFYPYDLEQAVGDLSGVRKGCVAVFGSRDPGQGIEQLVVVAETRTGTPAERVRIEREINALAVDLLGLPADVVVLAPPHAVLKTSSGKIRRAATRDAWRSGRLGAATRPPWQQAVRLFVASSGGRLRKLLARLQASLYGAWAWTWFGVLLVPAVLAILLLPGIDARWAVAHRLARGLAHITGCPLRVEGLERMPEGGCVVVSNHASYVDGFVIVAALERPVRFVAKAEFMRNRLLRRLFERMGTLFVERFDTRQSLADADALAAEATGQAPLLFFAEGTFTAQPGLRPFRLGAFRAAAASGLPVVPLVLRGTRALLRDGSWLPQRGPLEVLIGDPVQACGQDWKDIVSLRDGVRDAILEQSGENGAP